MLDESDDNGDYMIDIDQLINEVKQRPLLYNRHLTQYRNMHLKDKLWNEVFVRVIHNFNNLSVLDQDFKAKEVRKKWKNLKDSFLKQLIAERKWKNGSLRKQRTKYVHYDSLSFLLPIFKDNLDRSKVDDSVLTTPTSKDDLDSSKFDCTQTECYIDETPISPHSHSKESIYENRVSMSQFSPAEQHPSVLNSESPTSKLWNENNNENKKQYNEGLIHEDEDKLFATMLVPMLRKLNEDQKHFAKVEILNIMHRAKRYTEK